MKQLSFGLLFISWSMLAQNAPQATNKPTAKQPTVTAPDSKSEMPVSVKSKPASSVQPASATPATTTQPSQPAASTISPAQPSPSAPATAAKETAQPTSGATAPAVKSQAPPSTAATAPASKAPESQKKELPSASKKQTTAEPAAKPSPATAQKKEEKPTDEKKAPAIEQKKETKQPLAAASQPKAPQAEKKDAKAQPVSKEEKKEAAPTKEVKKEAPTSSKKEEPVKDQVQQDEIKRKELREGIDTLGQEGGNWLLKRQALESTVDLIEKINAAFNAMLDSRMKFIIQRNKVDRDFDEFLQKIGFELGDLSQLLDALKSDLEQDREEQGDLTEEERDSLDRLDKKIDEIQKLKADIKALDDLENSIDSVITQVDEEIKKGGSYQKQAWTNFQAIKKVLSDEKAEELYLKTDGLLKNLQDIQTYLDKKLMSYFDDTIKKLKENKAKVEDHIKNLKDSGLDLSKEIKRFVEDDENEYEQIEMPLEKPKPKVVQEKSSWFDYVSALWRYPIKWVGSFWSSITGSFGTSPSKPVKTAPNESGQEDTKKG